MELLWNYYGGIVVVLWSNYSFRLYILERW